MSANEKTLKVPDDAAGARLDKWLAQTLPDLSRSRLKTLIEAGSVKVGGKAADDPALRVKAGQTVKVVIPAVRDATPEAQAMALVIVYEDDALIVVDKPAGLVVHPAPGNHDQTLVNGLLAHCGDSLKGIGGERRPGIVHRIDKDTSGLIIAAKTEVAHTHLSAQFAAHSIDRRYDALVWGVPEPASDDIVGAMARSRFNRKKMAVVSRGGKAAETHYDTVEAFGTIAAHVRCKLKTGRTHQIRVHMASRGHPLIGDSVYGGAKLKSVRGVDPELVTALKTFPRQALHASLLGFTHPISGERLLFESPLPDDFVELRETLELLA